MGRNCPPCVYRVPVSLAEVLSVLTMKPVGSHACWLQVLNARFEVLHSMLDMLRDHQNNEHSTHLEWVVIILLVVEIVIGIVEILGLLGWIAHGK